MLIHNAEPQELSKAKRKFMAEAGLHLYSGGATVLRPADLYRFSEDAQVRSAMEGCNIYLIARRRRISVEPSSLRVSDGLLYGEFRLHDVNPFSYESFPFSQKTQLIMPTDGSPLRFISTTAENQFGFNVQAFASNNLGINLPAHVLVANTRHSLKSHTNLEVLYVGQGFGKDGKRLAIDRLLEHSTLQRIQAETAEEYPNSEILLLMFRYEHARNVLSTAGDFSIEPYASDEEELEHMKRSEEVRIERKSRITLAEAALINYFRPKYNIVHKDSFNLEKKRSLEKMKTLRKLFASDLTGLIVEINTVEFGSKLFTEAKPAATPEKFFTQEQINRWHSVEWRQQKKLAQKEIDQFVAEMTHAHIARFPLYNKTERESFLHALPWQ